MLAKSTFSKYLHILVKRPEIFAPAFRGRIAAVLAQALLVSAVLIAEEHRTSRLQSEYGQCVANRTGQSRTSDSGLIMFESVLEGPPWKLIE